jgi:hypothetical protein
MIAFIIIMVLARLVLAGSGSGDRPRRPHSFW